MTYQPGPYPPGYPSPYPNPYQYPPGYGYDPMQAALVPARRAGLLMIILGFLMLACAMCCGGVLLAPRPMLDQALTQAASGQAATLTPDEFRMASMVSMVVLIGLGLPMVILGMLVRRGGSGSIIAAIVLSVILLILIGLQILASGVQGGGANIIAGACIMILPASLVSLQLVWLAQAMRARGAITAMQMQYQQQYWQYGQQQQQQMYGQGYPPVAGSPNVQAPMPNSASKADPPPGGLVSDFGFRPARAL